MRFEATTLQGVLRILLEPIADERGRFVRLFDAARFAREGLVAAFPEQSAAFNLRRGTLRGLHLQREPHAETKIVRCVRGRAYDVILDARPASPTYGRCEAFELAEDDDLELYVPAGCAHGYQTLADRTELQYLISTPYVPEAATGFRFDSAALGISWPLEPGPISARDRALPEFVR